MSDYRNDGGADFSHLYPIPAPSDPVDWLALVRLVPWLVMATGWFVWFWFLLVPTAYDLHGVDRYPVANNILFVLTGLVLMLASGIAWQLNNWLRSTLFVLVIGILSYWF